MRRQETLNRGLERVLAAHRQELAEIDMKHNEDVKALQVRFIQGGLVALRNIPGKPPYLSSFSAQSGGPPSKAKASKKDAAGNNDDGEPGAEGNMDAGNGGDDGRGGQLQGRGVCVCASGPIRHLSPSRFTARTLPIFFHSRGRR